MYVVSSVVIFSNWWFGYYSEFNRINSWSFKFEIRSVSMTNATNKRSHYAAIILWYDITNVRFRYVLRTLDDVAHSHSDTTYRYTILLFDTCSLHECRKKSHRKKSHGKKVTDLGRKKSHRKKSHKKELIFFSTFN